MEIKVYNFFKVGSDFETVNNGQHCRFSAEQFACLERQYLLMGFRIFYDNECFISFSKKQ